MVKNNKKIEELLAIIEAQNNEINAYKEVIEINNIEKQELQEIIENNNIEKQELQIEKQELQETIEKNNIEKQELQIEKQELQETIENNNIEKQELQIEKQILQNVVDKQKEVIIKIYEQIRTFRRNMFGSKSDRISKEVDKILSNDIFNELELIDSLEGEIPEEFDSASIKVINKEKKVRKQRENNLKISIDKLEEIDETIYSNEDNCPYCNTKLHSNGYEVVEKLICVKSHYRKSVRRLQKKICNNINCTCSTQYTTRAQKDELYVGTYASSSVVSSMVVSKYIMGIPFYRQAQDFVRNGVDLSRQTITSWVSTASRALLPLADRMLKDLIDTNYVIVDETPMTVLSEKTETGNLKKTYIWCFTNPNKKILYYDWTPTRHGDYPKETLNDFNGILATDKYPGYNKVEGVEHNFCNAHARREITNYLKNHPNDPVFLTAIDLYAKLYAIEAKIKGKSSEVILKTRQDESRPIFDKLKEMYENELENISPKGPKAKAMNYYLNHYMSFQTYIDHPEVHIDSNFIESIGIRPITVGRKNYLFFKNPLGAKGSAILYSVVQTAKLHNLDIQSYLEYLLQNFEDLEIPSKIDEYLPYSKEIIEKFRVK